MKRFNLVEYIKDLLAFIFSASRDYTCKIKRIEIKENKSNEFLAIIAYKTTSSRGVQHATAKQINDEGKIFSDFPDNEAQMLVTLATLEKLIKMGVNSRDEIKNVYFDYVTKTAKFVNKEEG